MKIKFKKLSPEAKLPTRGTTYSAGLDLYALIDSDVTITKGKSTFIPTGLSVQIPVGYAGFVFPRSGLACKHGLTLSNCVGVIDSDYRGEIKISLVNLGDEDYTVKRFERVAQLIVIETPICEIEEDESLSETERGTDGFGSSGRL